MTKTYSQLILEQRYQIEALKNAGHNQTEVAKIVGVHKSTISREYKRNIPKRGTGAKIYKAEKAQKKTRIRHREKAKHVSFSLDLKRDCLRMMTEDKFSPELISATWRRERIKGVSHETIYKWIWLNKEGNRQENKDFKHLYLHLKHGRRRRKRGNYKDSRGLIPNRVFIDNRPKIVDGRKRLGDIEVDLIIGKNHKSGLLVTLDRASLVITMDKIKSKESEHIKELLQGRFEGNPHLKTMTFDNDQAFSLHDQLAKELSIETYFTRPYTSQDKGSIENRNGVIRRFFPKKTDFNEVSDQEIKEVETKLNNRPVRKFGYETPNEVFLTKNLVALIS